MMKRKRSFTTFQTIAVSFLLVTLLGSFLLMLPAATWDGKGADFGEALFTATSATCVTGLALHNTAGYWSAFGQAVILLLIQVGGIGVVTIGVIVVMFSGRKIGLMQRSTMQEAVSAHQLGGMVRYARFILSVIFLTELAGAVCLYPVFAREYGVGKGLWYALFHSVSAYCNAGFDLMGDMDGKTSLMRFEDDPFVLTVISLLIIAGGLGFLTWSDIVQKRFSVKKYHMQSKVVLVTSALLLAGAAVFFYFVEFGGVQWSALSGKERVLAALFQAVSPRTAGFNSVDLTGLSDSGKLVTILLMLVGGASGSTAGGFKVNTLSVLFLTALSVYQKQKDAQCFGRRISRESVYNATAIFTLYITLFLMGGIAISCMEHIPLMTALFETASAIATVGLSLGVTGSLGEVSRMILIVLMFFGRVGGLTMVFAMLSGKKASHAQFPEEKITVG